VLPSCQRFIAAALLATAAMTGCSANHTSSKYSGVPDAGVADARAFLMPDGLFRLPEAPTSQGSAFATAQLAAFLPRRFDWTRAARSAEPSKGDLAGLWAYVTILGRSGTRPDRAALTRLWTAVTLPPRADAGAEVGVVATYAAAYASLRALGIGVPPAASVVERLDRLTRADLTRTPYLAWRLQQARERLGLADAEGSRDLRDQFRDVALGVPHDDRTWLDTEAVVALDAARGNRGRRAEVIEAALRIAVSQSVDAAVRGSALTTAKALGGTIPRAVGDTLTGQADPRSGLLLERVPTHGQLNATYLFAKLLDSRFAEVAGDRTKNALYAVAADVGAPVAARLTAAVALRKSGDVRWRELIPVARSTATQQPREVGREQLADYLAVITPAVDIDAGVTKASFRRFAVPEGDELAQRDALAAINSDYLFADPSVVARSFSDMVAHLPRWASRHDLPPMQRVASAAALSHVGVDVRPGLLDGVGAELRSERGCRDARTLLSTDLSGRGSCSLVLTLQAIAIPGFLP